MAKSSATSRRAFLGTAAAGTAGVAVSTIGMTAAGASTPTVAISDVILTAAPNANGVFGVHVGEQSLSLTDLEFASKIAKAIA